VLYKNQGYITNFLSNKKIKNNKNNLIKKIVATWRFMWESLLFRIGEFWDGVELTESNMLVEAPSSGISASTKLNAIFESCENHGN
jgi:hypothetical protein